MKKPWKKPELLILERTRPEEALLNGCKTLTSQAGPNSANNQCTRGKHPRKGGCLGRCAQISNY
jgi:hypothetical protein